MFIKLWATPRMKLFIFGLIGALFQAYTIKAKSIAIIGAGAAGLTSAKYALDYNYEVTIFEKMEELGGVWYYTEKTGNNSYGVPIHSACYEGLRSNSPYQIMEYPDFPFPDGTKSFPTAKQVWNYLNSYAKTFKIKKHIRLNHLVENVVPLEGGRWHVFAKKFPGNKPIAEVFDAVLVCTNLYSYPYTPNFNGINEFKFNKIHSHDFRKAEAYRGKEVLIIGDGPSGVDIGHLVSKVAKRVTMSSNRRKMWISGDVVPKVYGVNGTVKPVVAHFTSNGAVFVDGTSQTFNAVIFATGYRYNFPFLAHAGIGTDDNLVYPLYYQILNVNYPTMALIGIPYLGCFHCFSLEARYALKFISGELSVTKEELNSNYNYFLQYLYAQNRPRHKSHDLRGTAKTYYDYLAYAANVPPIPTYFNEIFQDVFKSFSKDPTDFRNYRYLVDGEDIDKMRDV